MNKCDKIPNCQFFQKFPRHAASYMYVYCEGTKMKSCARLTYESSNGEPPPAGLTPTGLVIEADE
jgi:hypothetical protein